MAPHVTPVCFRGFLRRPITDNLDGVSSRLTCELSIYSCASLFELHGVANDGGNVPTLALLML